MDKVIIKKADYKKDFEEQNMETLKVLLPDKKWTIKNKPKDYQGQFEGVWIGIVDGDDENGIGMLANEPIMESEYNYGDEIEYQTIDDDSKPVIIRKIDISTFRGYKK